MKKIGFLLSALAFFSSCDDGDLVFDELNFSNKEIQTCQSLYYKINGKELLLVNLSNNSNGIVLDENAPLNQVQSIATNSTNQIIYRTYSDNVSPSTICSAIPPAQPVVVSEYISNPGGLIQYIRRSNVGFSNNKATINYNFTINFNNLTLSNDISEIKYENYSFGTIVYRSNMLNFQFTNFSVCMDQLISADSDEELILQLTSPFSFPNQSGEVSYALSSNQFILYHLYEGSIVNQDACSPKNNVLKEQWMATQGEYVIRTTEVVNAVTQNVDALKHEVFLRNVTFVKEGLSFHISELKIQEQTQPI